MLKWLFLMVSLSVGCALAQQPVKIIATELKMAATRFKPNTPVIVDVWVENRTKQDIERGQFSPLSSSVGLPSFVITRVPDGKEFSIPPGLYRDDWNQWYQPVSGKEAFSVGTFRLPAGKPIHLLHGDLRRTIVHAREHCQHELDEKFLLERPDNATTKKTYENIVHLADDFLAGGTFDIYVHAYSQSNTIRIMVGKNKESLQPSVGGSGKPAPQP